ncbi:MAG: hypothetical protein U5K79_24370 [Cyclobacteriaceae bacterium]|nr:hypothetical protein [Cyclobacteriaceae bacterium]
MKRSILVLAALFMAFSFAEGRNITISPGMGKLQLSIDNAAPHDTIFVSSGTYAESDIEISKPLTLIGLDMPVIDGSRKGEIFRILSDSVTIRGFLMQNVGYSFTQDWAGIRVEESDYIDPSKKYTAGRINYRYLPEKGVNTARNDNNVIKGKATNSVPIPAMTSLWYSLLNVLRSKAMRSQAIAMEFISNSWKTAKS